MEKKEKTKIDFQGKINTDWRRVSGDTMFTKLFFKDQNKARK